jgi:hypothetical protein
MNLMNNIAKVIVFVIIPCSLWSCSNTKNQSGTDQVSFSKYKTYKWVEDTVIKKTEYNPRISGKKIFELDIREEVNNELKSRGFVMVDEKPDFLVSSKATLEKFDNSNNTDWARSAGKGLSSPNGATVGSTGVDMSPDAGNTTNVKITLIDPTTKNPIWIGSKTKVVGEVMTLTGSLEDDVSAIFKKHPVAKKRFIKP